MISKIQKLADDPHLGVHICIPEEGKLPPITIGLVLPTEPNHRIVSVFHAHIHQEHIRLSLPSLAAATFLQLLRIQRWWLFRFPQVGGGVRICSSIQQIAYWVWKKTYAE